MNDRQASECRGRAREGRAEEEEEEEGYKKLGSLFLHIFCSDILNLLSFHSELFV